MRRSRITITLDQGTLNKIDQLIDKNTIRNRSHAIEFALNQFLAKSVNKAVILAGGQGTSMRPYTYELPKSMLLVKGKPILEHLLIKLKKSGINEVILCIGYLGDKIKEYFGNGERFGIKLTYSEDTQEVHTGGALAKAKKYIRDETFLVIHGDILFDFSFNDFIDFHKKQGEIATVALTTVEKPTQFGQLTMQGTKLVNFYQKEKQPNVKSYLIHGGIYAFEPEIFSYFPTRQTNFSLEDIVEKLIKSQKVTGFMFEGQWFDVGTPENYEKAIKEYKL